MAVEEETCVNVAFNEIQDVLITVAQEVVGYRVCRDRVQGIAWWTDEMKGAIEEKKKAYKKMLQRNVSEEVSARRNKYKVWKKKVKELVNESKMRIDEFW